MTTCEQIGARWLEAVATLDEIEREIGRIEIAARHRFPEVPAELLALADGYGPPDGRWRIVATTAIEDMAEPRRSVLRDLLEQHTARCRAILDAMGHGIFDDAMVTLRQRIAGLEARMVELPALSLDGLAAKLRCVTYAALHGEPCPGMAASALADAERLSVEATRDYDLITIT